MGGYPVLGGLDYVFPEGGVSTFRVTLGLVVPENALPIPVYWYFYFSMSFVVVSNILVA